ncbi:MAG: DinB family protein [Trueperaceae bacterium]|nr:DinB family protein [Trueperaceae bacterium]
MDPARPTAPEPATLLLAETVASFALQKAMAERAFAQLPDDAWHRALGREDNSIAVLVRHLAGNLGSRWRDVFTTDGEKPDRDRDGEFEATERSPDELRAEWAAAWAITSEALASFTATDLTRTVVIRGEPTTLAQALVRSLTHLSGHVGQIVLLAKHHAGDDWSTPSIPRRRAG